MNHTPKPFTTDDGWRNTIYDPKTTAAKLSAHATTADDLLKHYRERVLRDWHFRGEADEPIIYPRKFPLIEESRTGQRVIYLRAGDLVGITVEEIDKLREQAGRIENDRCDKVRELRGLLRKTEDRLVDVSQELGELRAELAAAAQEAVDLKALASVRDVENHNLRAQLAAALALIPKGKV